MAGMIGFSHSCDDERIEKNKYRSSLKESAFNSDECDLLWDFYVARSFAATTGAPITLDVYGWDNTNSKLNGYPALENALANNAGITSFGIIRAKTIKDTLAAMNLSGDHICISHARAVLMQNYTCEIDENENVKIKSGESRINAIFRHMRNSLAHGNTYFFDNDMCLLEDKNGSSITAEILIPRHSLLEWVFIVDKNGAHYTNQVRSSR